MTYARVCTFLLLATTAAFAAKPGIVKTTDGKVKGSYDSAAKIYSFKGIPYAAPPVGKLRWQPPQPAAKWRGVKDADKFGSRCMQPHFYDDMIFRDPGQSENCLTLNVWTSDPSLNSQLPVMFWIHGGGFFTGASSEPRQDGTNLAKRGVVVVSLNYRLGVFGFMAHPELTAESSHHSSGNYGLEDMTAALQWVHQNIGAFGGDASKVTIFGESAGSWAVSQLMASPISKALFARAIGESGAAFSAYSLGMLTLAAAEKQGAALNPSLEALRAMSAEDLLKSATTPVPTFNPIVDGYFFSKDVPAIYAEGSQAHIPLLAGWNANEGGTPAHQKATVESFAADAEKNFGAQAAEFLRLYPAGTLEEAKRSASEFAGDQFIAAAAWRWIDAQAATGHSPVYRYYFTHILPPPADAGGAYHSADIEFVFDNLANKQLKWRDEDLAVAKLMSAYWTNFAKTGDPNGEGLPQWPIYKGDDASQVMKIDTVSTAIPEEHRSRYLFLSTKLGS